MTDISVASETEINLYYNVNWGGRRYLYKICNKKKHGITLWPLIFDRIINVLNSRFQYDVKRDRKSNIRKWSVLYVQ